MEIQSREDLLDTRIIHLTIFAVINLIILGHRSARVSISLVAQRLSDDREIGNDE